MNEIKPSFFTMNDLIQVYKLSKSTIYRLIREGGFPAPKKIGKSSRWRVAEVEKWADKS